MLVMVRRGGEVLEEVLEEVVEEEEGRENALSSGEEERGRVGMLLLLLERRGRETAMPFATSTKTLNNCKRLASTLPPPPPPSLPPSLRIVSQDNIEPKSEVIRRGPMLGCKPNEGKQGGFYRFCCCCWTQGCPERRADKASIEG